MRRLALPALLLVSCQDTGGSERLAPGDVGTYQSYIHPILEARCATLDCHGAADRPLRLYAETGRRESDALRDQPITRAELEANVRALAAIDPEAEIADSLVLRKPLADGVFHEGGEQWLSPEAHQPVCVRSWLAGVPEVAACTAALAEPDVKLRDP